MPDLPAPNLPAHARLFAELGQEFGIEDLSFDEAGVCVMSFDDIVLRFQYQPDRDEILVSGEIGELNEDAPADICKELLVFNAASAAAGGGSVGYDAADGMLTWFDRMAPRAADQRMFQKWVEAALARQESWQAMLQGLQAGKAGEPVPIDAYALMIRI